MTQANLAALVSLSLVFAASSTLAASQQSRPEQATQSGKENSRISQKSSSRMPSSITVTSASNLIGKNVRDSRGEESGEVERILIDARNGDVAQLLVVSGGLFDIGEEMVAVPWHAVQKSRGDDGIRLSVRQDALNKAPRYSEERLSELTEPLTITQITNYYAPLVASPDGNETSRSKPDAERRQDSAVQNQAQNDPKKSKNTAQSGTSKSDESVPHFLIARDAVTVLAPPLFMSGSDIQGTTVVDKKGEELGSVDQVMIDMNRGKVAYVLLERGGFLGMGGDWTPVPLAALQWTPGQDAGFVLNADPSALKEGDAFGKDDLPSRVNRRDLQQLHQRFGVTPYWQESQTAAADDKQQ